MMVAEGSATDAAKIVFCFFERELQVSIIDLPPVGLGLQLAQRKIRVETAANDQMQGGRRMLD